MKKGKHTGLKVAKSSKGYTLMYPLLSFMESN